MGRQIFILSILVVSACKLRAQLNESDTAKFQLRTSVTGNYQRGNVEVLNVRGRLEFSFLADKDWVFKSQNVSLYQAFYSVKADNDIFSRNYFYYKSQHRLYPFAIVYASTNFRRKIDARYFAGGGITWQAIHKKNNVFKISAARCMKHQNLNQETIILSITMAKTKLISGGEPYFLVAGVI